LQSRKPFGNAFTLDVDWPYSTTDVFTPVKFFIAPQGLDWEASAAAAAAAA
jgi:hypothetical protein